MKTLYFMGGVISIVISKALQLLVNVLFKNASISVLHAITTNKTKIKTITEFYPLSTYIYYIFAKLKLFASSMSQ